MNQQISGRVIVGDKTYLNQWVEPGKTIRQVDSLDELCMAHCVDHGWRCGLRVGDHKQHPAGHILHVCAFGHYGHHFYVKATA